jgi:hypothetical protein
MSCPECHRELNGATFGCANAADSAAVGHSGCCSPECAILDYLSQLFALDKQALLRVLVRFGEDPTEVMFLLEDAVMKAQAVGAR